MVKRSKVRAWINKLTEFKLGENYSSVECNMWDMFKVVRSDEHETEIWHILDLCIKNTWKSRTIAKLLLFLCNLGRSSDVKIFSERELSSRSLYVIGRRFVCRLSVCLSSVTLVHPTQAIEIFGNISTPCGIWPSRTLYKIFTEIVPGNPSVGGVTHKRGSRIQRFWTYLTLYLGNGAW